MSSGFQLGFNAAEMRNALGEWASEGAEKIHHAEEKLAAFDKVGEMVAHNSPRFVNSTFKAAQSLLHGTEHGISSLGHKAFDKLPVIVSKPLAALAGAYGKVNAGLGRVTKIGQSLAVDAMKERGLSAQTTARIAHTLSVCDTTIKYTASASIAHAITGLGGPAGFAAAQGVKAIPIASMAYVGYSTVKNPLATIRAARETIRKIKGHELSHNVLSFAEAIDKNSANSEEDNYLALVCAACDETGDATAAMKLADKACPAKPKLQLSTSWELSWPEHLTLELGDDTKMAEYKKTYNNMSSWLSKNKGHKEEKSRRKLFEAHKELMAKHKEKMNGGKSTSHGSGVGKGVSQSGSASGTGKSAGQSGSAGGAKGKAGGGTTGDGGDSGGGKLASPKQKGMNAIADEDHWITLAGGQHILVKEGMTVGDAIHDHFLKKIASGASWQSKNKEHPDEAMKKLKAEELAGHKKQYANWKAGKNAIVKAKEGPKMTAAQLAAAKVSSTPILMDGRPGLTQKGDLSLVSKDLKNNLSPDQQQGVALAVNAMKTGAGGFLLADGTGAGKTREQLAVAKTFADEGRPVIIVSPNQVLNPKWATKTKEGFVTGSFADDSKTMGIKLHLNDGSQEVKAGEIHVTTYNSLHGLAERMDKDPTFKPIIIWDEAHELKNADSGKARLGKFMNDRAAGVLFATATPADKAGQLDYLERAGIFGKVSPDAARKELGMVQKTNKEGDSYWVTNPKIGTQELAGRMQKVFDSLTEQGRTVKREISMEGVSTTMDKLPMPQECKNRMAQIESMYDGQKMKGGIIYMQQRRVQEEYKLPHMVAQTVKDLKAGKQVVLFIDRVKDSVITCKNNPGGGSITCPGSAALLRKQLEAAGVDPKDIVDIHGGATKAEQRKGQSRFQSGDAKVVIGTIASAGTGINLDDRKGDAPRSTYIATCPLSPVHGVQAAGRTWRTTTKSKPEMHFLFGDTGIDGKNAALYAGKMSLLHAAVGGQTEKLNVPNDLSDDGIADYMAAQEASEKSGHHDYSTKMQDPDWHPVWLQGKDKPTKADWTPSNLTKLPYKAPPKPKVNKFSGLAVSFEEAFNYV